MVVQSAGRLRKKQLAGRGLGSADELDPVVVEVVHHRDESPSFRASLDGHLGDVPHEERLEVLAQVDVVCRAEGAIAKLLEGKHRQGASRLGNKELASQKLQLLSSNS